MDMVPIITFALLFIVFSMVGYKIYQEFQAAHTFTSTQGQTIMGRMEGTFDIIDNIFMFILLGLGIATIIGAVKIRTSPAFFFISILLFAVMIFLSAQFSNVFEKIALTSALSTTTSKFDASTSVMDNLPMVVLGLGALTLLVMYSVNKLEI